MNEIVRTGLGAWQSYYLIIATSASALIGIQFVVITLIANQRRPVLADSIAAFGTPTVVQFTSALAISALLNVPWGSLWALSLAVGSCGAIGLVYCATVIRKARRQTHYMPEGEDWIWYAILPISAYASLVVAALLLGLAGNAALPILGMAVLGLLLIGIHNAWDTVTHVILLRQHPDQKG